MNMDDKIRQAFRRATPNMMPAAAQETAAPAAKRKKFSPKFTEFVATAAAIALLIGAVGTTAWRMIGQYGSDPTVGASSPSDQPTDPLWTQDEPGNTDPSNTIPWPTDPAPDADLENYIAWIKTYVCDLVCWSEDVQPDVLPAAAVITEDNEIFLAQISHHGYEYEFTFDNAGTLLDIQIPLCNCVKEGYISLDVAEKIALLRAQELGRCVLYTSCLDTESQNVPFWCITVQSTEGLWTAEYRIGALTGELISSVEPPMHIDPAAYYGIIAQYQTALIEQWSAPELMDEDMNYLIRDIPPENLGYGLYDLDGNGIAELVIGTTSGDDYYGKMILDLYVLDENGKAQLIFQTSERNRYYYAGGARFANLGSSGANESIDTTIELSQQGWTDLAYVTDPADYVRLELEPLISAQEPPMHIDPAAYYDILAQYKTALSEQWSFQQLSNADMSYLVRDVALESIGYGFYDLDGNGIAELVIGTTCDDDFFGKMIFDLYTLDESENASLIFRSFERKRFYYAGGPRFANLGSSGADSSFETTLELYGQTLLDLDYVTGPADYVQLELEPLIASSEPSDKTLSEVGARDLALQQVGVALDDVRCLKIGSEYENVYTVYFEDDAWGYTFYINSVSADILYDPGVESAPSREQELLDGIFNWKSARDKCMAVHDSRIENLIGMNYTLFLDTPQAYSDTVDFYSFELYFTDGSYQFWVDARTGEIICGDVDDTNGQPEANVEAATDAALEYAGLTREQITDFSYKYDDRFDADHRYWIYFTADGSNYEIAVHAVSLTILECNVSK